MSLPFKVGSDSAVVWAEIAHYRPEPGRDTGAVSRLPADGNRRCDWEFTGGWVIFTREGARWYGGPELQDAGSRALCHQRG